ncbi:MAG: site-specific integrase [Deltaproteobacteria bacterium]|nr:site-specific integrase [Deltaproteobacteria bacterium]
MAQRNGTQKRATRHAGLPSKDHTGWRIRWVDMDGKRRSRNFPKYKDAVAELARIKGDMQAIKDGRKVRLTNVATFEKFVEDYYAPNKAAHKKRPEDDLSILRNHLLPMFGTLPLTQITTERVEALKADLRGRGLATNTIRNVLACLSAIMHYALELEMVVRLPRIKKPKPVVPSYAYLKNDNQIRAFLESAKDHGEGPHAFYATAIFTGMRAGELFGLRWADVDLERRLITVRRSFDKPTKSGHVRHVPILDVLYPVLRSWRLQNANDLVFPNAAGNMHTPSPRLVKETFPATLKTAKLPPMRFHDLRHTFASQWVMRGGDLFKLQKILGHADQQMVQRYAHLAPEAFDSDRNIFGTDAPQADNVATL